MAPRNRSKANESLAAYPGLYRNAHDVYFVVHPLTRKRGSLETKDRVIAIQRWSALQRLWQAEISDSKTDSLAKKLSDLATPRHNDGEAITLSHYLKKWRVDVLGHCVVGTKVKWSTCQVLSLRGPNKGRPIALPTRIDYANDAKQLEEQESADFLLTDPDILRRIRQLLSPWMQKPTHYNGLRNTLNRVFLHAVQEGLIDRNPMVDIRKATESKREVLIPDDAYKEITAALCIHKINKQTRDGTWRAKICDLMYMLSQQPIDIFDLKQNQAEIFMEPVERDGYSVYGLVRFERHKTRVGIELEMNKELAELWQWFIEFKRSQNITSEYLLVYPMYFDVRSRAQKVQHRTIQAAWRKACKETGYGDQYQLRDLRKKGLTEEYLEQGENDKGGHETEAMRKHYRLIKPPKRARTTIRFTRD
ncbi:MULTISPECIES: hypothetical protein [unclassified Marinobacter]|uniref:hypothetical protein n=1 Tax=unclassified Marinobacter TaxID=83889 RepID=UPI001D1909E0|nr:MULTISPECIES: hypothetical protein [unclassified Marinobacter]|tara:strand:+ start:1014 stop:2273 length:1260 start_codon:yes stop_codon:yes gene_type:complete